MTEDDAPRARATHEVGQALDALSLHEIDGRVALLRAEIARLEAAAARKRQALDAAGSVFGRQAP